MIDQGKDLNMKSVDLETTPFKGPQVSLWLLSALMCSACTLDFEDFEPYTTPEGYRDAAPTPDMDPMPDMDPTPDMLMEDGFVMDPDLGMDLDGDGVLD
jgi:hypothetical protein